MIAVATAYALHEYAESRAKSRSSTTPFPPFSFPSFPSLILERSRQHAQQEKGQCLLQRPRSLAEQRFFQLIGLTEVDKLLAPVAHLGVRLGQSQSAANCLTRESALNNSRKLLFSVPPLGTRCKSHKLSSMPVMNAYCLGEHDTCLVGATQFLIT